jgi:hypothetical protein
LIHNQKGKKWMNYHKIGQKVEPQLRISSDAFKTFSPVRLNLGSKISTVNDRKKAHVLAYRTKYFVLE